MEHRELNPPIFDDAFQIDEIVHKPTIQVCMPANEPAKVKQLYDDLSVKRYYSMIQSYLTISNKEFRTDFS